MVIQQIDEAIWMRIHLEWYRKVVVCLVHKYKIEVDVYVDTLALLQVLKQISPVNRIELAAQSVKTETLFDACM